MVGGGGEVWGGWVTLPLTAEGQKRGGKMGETKEERKRD